MTAWLPLTAAQRGLFFAQQLAPDNPCYTTAEVVEFAGPVDPERLSVAIASAYGEFEQLRTVFRSTPEGPQQRVVDRGAPLQVIEADSPSEAESWMRADLARPMDLTAVPIDSVRTALLRLPGGRTWWYHAAHHVVLDGYGAQQLIRRVAELYADPSRRRPSEVGLAELVEAAPSDPAGEDVWAGRLAGMEGIVSLAGRTADASATAIRRSMHLTDAQQRELVRGARTHGVGWPDLTVAAVGSYIARMNGSPHTRVGVPLMNRSMPNVGALTASRTACTAMNVLPVTIHADGSIARSVSAVRAEQEALREHPFTRQEDLARRLRSRDEGAQLFGAQINLVPFTLEVTFEGVGSPVSGVVRNLTAGPVEDLTVGLRGAPGRGNAVALELDANPALYHPKEVDLHLQRLAAWIETYAAAPVDAAIEDLPLLTHEERDLVVNRFNATGVDRRSATLAERFVDQASCTPNATALMFRGGRRTYGQLLRAARRVASALASEGVVAGDVVGVALPRGFELFEAVYGIQLLGAVYLPIDLDLPPARVEGMLEDAAAAYVVTGDNVEGLTGYADECLRAMGGGRHVDTPAYLLFTSGSTGRPKGVVVSHRAIDNRLAWMQHHLPLCGSDRVLHKTPISFDVSIWELFWPLQVGAAVVIAPPGDHRDPRALADLVVSERVSTTHFVPSMLRAFLGDRTARESVSRSAVRHVVTSGEALTPDLVTECMRWFGTAPTNLYGPTEAAVDVTCWDCSPGDRAVPIGRPIWNTRCYVLDSRRRPVPIGASGELWIAGVQLADGYVGRPDLTQERFVPDPFRPGERMYKTGDLASWRADGALRYLGRDDDQVKIRGQRVELGEIEALFAAVPEVGTAAAGVVDGRLIAWFAPAAGCSAAEAARTLRETATAQLPRAWMPHRFVCVPDIPLGTAGKIDRRRLVRQATPPPAPGGRGSPGDLLEERLCALVGDVLDLPAASPDADFFTIGGDSLTALKLIGAVEDDLGETLRLADVFAHPTPTGLARVVAGTSSRSGETDELLTLRRGGDRAPLFLLPPAGGLGWCYAGLLHGLPTGLPVHTIQAPGLADGSPAPVADLGALADRQLGAIRQVVGRGRFHVAGWSLGGMAAHEVASRARADGQEVGAVILLDAYPSDQWRHLSEPTEADTLVGILRLGGVEPPEAGGRLDRDTTKRLLRESGSAVGRLPDRVLEGCMASVVEAARLVRTSRHSVLSGDLNIVVATAPRAESWLDHVGWKAYVDGEVHRTEVDVTHGALVRRPAADRVASLISALCDG